MMRGLHDRQLGFGHLLAPDAPGQLGHDLARVAGSHHPPAVDDGHRPTQLAHIFHDVRRQDHDDLLADLGDEVEKAPALRGIESRRRFVDDEQLGPSGERDGDAEPLLHPTGEGPDMLLAHLVQVHLVEQVRHQRLSRPRSAIPFSVAK